MAGLENSAKNEQICLQQEVSLTCPLNQVLLHVGDRNGKNDQNPS